MTRNENSPMVRAIRPISLSGNRCLSHNEEKVKYGNGINEVKSAYRESDDSVNSNTEVAELHAT
ncbi:hypothetical protein [Yersinia aldovae]|uniref:hypothetical protein n=1 Tax=Yersinia aldovae TaxID=29483 RepID=UPI001AD7FD74|nr:hypothetical protein [Yersinia aldovae]